MADNILDGFDQLSDQLEQQRKTALAAAYTGNEHTPEQAARANTISDQVGQPFGVVAANLDSYEQDQRRQSVESAGARSAPVGEFLSDPRRMALASDDAGGLADLHGALTSDADGTSGRGWRGIMDRWLSLPGNVIARGLARSRAGEAFAQGDTQAVASMWHALTDQLDQFSAPLRPLAQYMSVQRPDGSVDEDATSQVRAAFTDPLGTQAAAQQALAVSKEVSADQQVSAQAIGGRPTLGDFRKDPGKATEQFFAYYGNQGAQSLPAMLLAVATRNPEVGGALMGVSQGSQTYTDLRADGIGRDRARVAGIGTGLIESALGSTGLEHATAPGVRALLTSPLVEAGTEAATQWGQTDVEDWARGSTTPLPEKLSQVMDAAILGYGFGLAEKGSSVAMDPESWTSAASAAVEQGRRALGSADNAAKLGQIAKAAAGVKLGERSPADLQAFVQQAGGDGNVYLDAKQAQVLFQSQPEVLADLVGSQQALAEQQASGDLVIPMARWATVVPRLANADEIVRHSRMNAGDLSAAEMDALDVDALAAEMGMPAQQPEATERKPETSAQVQQDVQAQLIGTGRYTPAAAETQAKLWGAAFKRFGDATGQDAMGLYQRYSGGVSAGEAAQAVAGGLSQSAMAAQIDTPAFQNWFGESKVLDDSSSPLTVYHGTAEDFDVFLDKSGRATGHSTAGLGHFFTSDRSLAERYAENASDGVPADERLIDAYLSIKNPYELTLDEAQSLDTPEAAKAFRQFLERAGYDGIHIPEADNWIAFRSNQIKSASQNRGTFDPQNPSILFQSQSAQKSVEANVRRGNAAIARALTEKADQKRAMFRAGLGWVDFVWGSVGGEKKSTGGKIKGKGIAHLIDGRMRKDGLTQGQAEQVAARMVGVIARGEEAYRTEVGDSVNVGIKHDGATAILVKKKGSNGWVLTGWEDEKAPDATEVGSDTGGATLERPTLTRPSEGAGAEESLRQRLDTFNQAAPEDSATAPRGQIEIGPDRSMRISLFEGADKSTFLHESGHFFLEVFRDIAGTEGAPQQVRDDFAGLLDWLGVESADQIGTAQHEQFARGFEAYLGEGKAPTPELQSVFSQFKRWLLGIYRTLRNLDVDLTDEVRGVFDRMLASEQEIEAAQQRTGWQPLATTPAEAKSLGLTERQFERYQAQVAATVEQAKADLQAELEEVDRRQRERWWKDELRTVRGEVQAEVEATPAVRAYRVLTGRAEAAGAPVPEALRGMKLDKAALVDAYGKDGLKDIGRVYARDGGVDQDTAAAVLGFRSGDELVQALRTVPHVLGAVAPEADARMRARHGDPMANLPDRAMDAVHGNRRIKLLERELNMLADLAGVPAPSRRQLKAIAQQLVARKTARQLRPNDYLAAERKAAREATEAAGKGKFAEALQAKRRQALNAALFAEARAAVAEIDAAVAYMRRQVTPAARQRLGLAGKDYLDAMDAIAQTYEFADVSGKAVARRESLRAWVEARQADDDLTAIPDGLLERVEAERVTNYADLPLADLRDLHDAVRNIAHLAKLKNQLLKNKDARDWGDAQAELSGAIQAAIKSGKPLPFSDADLTRWQKLGQAYTGLMDWVLRPETVVEWLDGGETGPWHDYLWNQAEAAQQSRIDLRNRVGGMLAEVTGKLTRTERADLQRLVHIRSLNRSVSRNTIIAVALNMGNAGNREKLMRGGYVDKGQVVPFTDAAIAEMLGNLTQKDAEMVQGIWDAVNSLWPDIVAQQERLSGVPPEKVEPAPLTFTTRDGTPVTLRGGYYPAVYDPRVGKAGVKQARAAEEQIMGGNFSRAMTSKGHTKERTEYAAPMLLDYHRVLSRHLNDVITDLSHRGYVKQALRVLEDPELKALIQERLSEGAYHALHGSVKNAVRGASVAEPGSSMAEKIGDAVLTNTAVAALGFRIPLVFANTVVAPIQAAARVGPQWLAKGYLTYYRNPMRQTTLIHELSPFMAERSNSLDESYQAVLGKLSGKTGIRAAAMKVAMEVHRWTVPLAERAIWMGRYQQAQAAGAGMDEAVRLADKAIRQTQQAGAPKDLAAAERDPRYKWVRMFIGPMVIMNNRLQESGMRGLFLGKVQSPARALGTWLAAAVLSNAMFELAMLRGPSDDDDDGLGWDDWAAWLARKSLLFPFQTFPLLRDVASGIEAAMTGKQASGRPNPIVDAGVALTKFGQTAWAEGRDWVADGEDPDIEKLTKAGVRAAGPVTGLPSNQMLTTGEYLYDVSTGQYTPDNPAEAAAYLMYRRPKDKQ